MSVTINGIHVTLTPETLKEAKHMMSHINRVFKRKKISERASIIDALSLIHDAEIRMSNNI